MRGRGRKRGRQTSNGSADKRAASPSEPATPSPSKSSPGKSSSNKTLKQRVPISESFIEYQQVRDMALSTADVHLICPDGLVPVHTVVLQSVSPFFEKMFVAQGDYYFGARPVIIPDFSIAEIGRMVQFIYTGLANASKSELENMKKLLKYFEISVQSDKIITEKKASPLPAQRPILCFIGNEAEDVKLFSTAASGIKRKADDEEDLPAGAKRINVTKKGQGTLDKDVMVVMPRNKTINGPLSKKKEAQKSVVLEHISSTDTSDGEIEADECRNSEWFVREARRCQKCDKTYDKPAEASSCLTNNHNRLRCYLCFKVVRDTSKLFIHFSKKHKKGAREQSLLCCWCDQAVPYKSVSCHVISLHLTTMMNVHANPNPLKTIRRPVAIFQRAGTSSAGLNPSKALTENSEKKGEDTEGADKDKDFSMTKKDGNEAAKDVGLKSQKQTIKIKSICGKTRVFVVNLDIK